MSLMEASLPTFIEFLTEWGKETLLSLCSIFFVNVFHSAAPICQRCGFKHSPPTESPSSRMPCSSVHALLHVGLVGATFG